IGICVAAAVLAQLAWRREWRPAAVALVICAAAVGGWQAWTATAAAANAAIPQAAAFGYDLNYALWLPRDIATLARVVVHNAATLVSAVFLFVICPPDEWLGPILSGDPRRAAVGYLAMLAVVVLCAVGLWGSSRRLAPARCRRQWPAAHVYLLLYLGLVLVWPFYPQRFLGPILPLLFAALLAGLWRTIEAARSLLSSATAGSVLSQPALAATLLFGGWVLFRCGSIAGSHLAWPERAAAQAQREQISEIIRARTPPDAVISGMNNGYFHLASGRKFVPLVPLLDPISTFYPPDRPILQFGRGVTREKMQAFIRMFETQAAAYYRSVGVTHVLAYREEGPEMSPFRRFRQRQSGLFTLLVESGDYRLYRFHATVDAPNAPF
ncbi:MAG: hypothetical protein ACREE7_07300, partial [Dongiaceae bacterium]